MAILEILKSALEMPAEKIRKRSNDEKLAHLQAMRAGQALLPGDLSFEPIDEVMAAVDVLIQELRPDIPKLI